MRVVFLVLLIAPLVLSQRLRCFRCTNCDEDEGSPRLCDEDQDTCMKVEIGEHIVRKCGKKSLCGENKAWRDLKRVFSQDNNDEGWTYCCDENYCNSSTLPLPSSLSLFFVIAMTIMLQF